MTEARPYLLWGDVNIEEEVEVMKAGVDTVGEFSTWTATFEGSVHSDVLENPYHEPRITFSRTGATAMDAAQKLAVVADSQGWDIR